jgi:hypothetical protein
MVLPLWLVLIPYGLILATFLLFSFFNLWHLFHFGFFTFSSALFVLAYLFISAALLLWTYQSLKEVDWSQPLYSLEHLSQFNPPEILP